MRSIKIMAGFTKIYCFGNQGRLSSGDGINHITMEVLVGDGNRQWLEPRYYTNFKPIANISRIVPEAPYQDDNLLLAAIIFSPIRFRACRSLKELIHLLDINIQNSFLDIDRSREKYWYRSGVLQNVMKQARPISNHLNIFQADLKPLRRNSTSLN